MLNCAACDLTRLSYRLRIAFSSKATMWNGLDTAAALAVPEPVAK
jgi:hypothetical protein